MSSFGSKVQTSRDSCETVKLSGGTCILKCSSVFEGVSIFMVRVNKDDCNNGESYYKLMNETMFYKGFYFALSFLDKETQDKVLEEYKKYNV